MRTKIGKLIADIEEAEHDIQTLISLEDDPDPGHLKDLDTRFEGLFTQLFNEKPDCSQQRLERIRYLLALIDKNSEGSELINKLTKAVLKDVLFISGDNHPINSEKAECSANADLQRITR